MRKQKLYFVADKDSAKTRQYYAVSNVRAEAEKMRKRFGPQCFVKTLMVEVSD